MSKQRDGVSPWLPKAGGGAPAGASSAPEARRLAAILDMIVDAVIATDEAGRITFMNRRAYSLSSWPLDMAFGEYEISDVLVFEDERGRPIDDPLTIAFRREQVTQAFDGARLVTSLGKIEVESTALLVTNERGECEGGLIVLRDVSEKRRLAEDVARAGRLASAGLHSAGLAHEINNALAALVSNLPYIAHQLEIVEGGLRGGEVDAATLLAQVQVTRQAVSDANEGARRIRDVVEQARHPARVRPPGHPSCDLPAVIETVLRFTAPVVRARARVRWTRVGQALVRADEGRLIQILINVLLNAAEAMPEGCPEENYIEVSVTREPGNWVVLVVRDNGFGIDEGVLPRIFEPYFSTKTARGGTGLGLSICRDLVRSMGGTIQAARPPGGGAQITITLPGAVARVAIRNGAVPSGGG